MNTPTRWTVTATATALVTVVTGWGAMLPAAAVEPAPDTARAAVGWLATQLTGGVVHNDQYDFDDLGLTVDIGLTLDEVGGDEAMVRQVRQTMSTRIDDYAAPSAGEKYSGPLAKSLVFAAATGADPRTYGGIDLVAETEGRVIAAGPSAGRLQDLSAFGDYANTFGQAYAARGLAAAGSPKAPAVIDFLLQQQCDGGNFRIFFDTDKSAAEQGCVDGVDPADVDATALVVTQLREIADPSPQVASAIDRAVAWLASAQRSDGSFGGSPVTPDPNTNSTGLAASALAAGGRCEQAGRAAEWVTTLQVGRPAAGSPLAGQDGAIAYDRAALERATREGITTATQDQWRRATVQSGAGLTHRLGTTRGVVLQAPQENQPTASAVVLRAVSLSPGDRYCLTGPGIAGSRTVVVGQDGVLRTSVRLPATAGVASYRLAGRDGAVTAVVKVGPAPLSSVSAVTLKGPRGFQRAGTRAPLEVLGAAAGSRYVLRGAGIAGDVQLQAGPDGVLSRLVTLPATTGPATYTLVGAGPETRSVTVRVLASERLRVRVASNPTRGKRKVLVTRLEPRERVTLVVAGEVVDRGRASRRGRFVTRLVLPEGARVRAVGELPTRKGAHTAGSRR